MIVNTCSLKKTSEGQRANDSERKSLAARFLKRPNSANRQKGNAELNEASGNLVTEKFL